MKPTIGRIVLYKLVGDYRLPAIIQRVSQDGTLWLCIFNGGGPEMKGGVTQGDGEGQWNWLPQD